MPIEPFAAGSYANDRSTANLIALKGRLDTLTTQLSTGRAAQTYGGLGTGRMTSLSAHAAISALDGYSAAITSASTRVSLLATSLTQIKTLGDTVRNGLLANLQSTTSAGVSKINTLARTNLDAVADALNQPVDGQYIFAGRKTDTEPVVSTDTMLYGDAGAGLAGLKTLITEQRAADLGAGSNGRLTQSQSGTSVTLTEDPDAEARANFGFTLIGATSSNPAGVSATLTAGTAATTDLAFASQPKDGDRVRVAVLNDDGSQTLLDLTARTSVPSGATDSFAIGATAADTAANLETFLGGAKVASVQSASPPGLSATFSGGGAGSVALSVGTPQPGDTFTLTVQMHDGTRQAITLKAQTSVDAGSTTAFALGATASDTAANLSSALDTALKAAAGTTLSASSAARAAGDFFAGSSSPGLAPRRVSGNGYAETASASTVIWYRGDDSSPDPRATATVQVGAAQKVSIGAQANETPIRATLAGLAVLAVDSFADATGTVDTTRFQAAAERSVSSLRAASSDGGLAQMTSEISAASTSMSDAKTQARTTKAALQDSLEGVETVSTEEVAAKLLTLQTQLQASYQVTSMLSKLSLVNYLG